MAFAVIDNKHTADAMEQLDALHYVHSDSGRGAHVHFCPADWKASDYEHVCDKLQTLVQIDMLTLCGDTVQNDGSEELVPHSLTCDETFVIDMTNCLLTERLPQINILGSFFRLFSNAVPVVCRLLREATPQANTPTFVFIDCTSLTVQENETLVTAGILSAAALTHFRLLLSGETKVQVTKLLKNSLPDRDLFIEVQKDDMWQYSGIGLAILHPTPLQKVQTLVRDPRRFTDHTFSEELREMHVTTELHHTTDILAHFKASNDYCLTHDDASVVRLCAPSVFHKDVCRDLTSLQIASNTAIYCGAVLQQLFYVIRFLPQLKDLELSLAFVQCTEHQVRNWDTYWQTLTLSIHHCHELENLTIDAKSMTLPCGSLYGLLLGKPKSVRRLVLDIGTLGDNGEEIASDVATFVRIVGKVNADTALAGFNFSVYSSEDTDLLKLLAVSVRMRVAHNLTTFPTCWETGKRLIKRHLRWLKKPRRSDRVGKTGQHVHLDPSEPHASCRCSECLAERNCSESWEFLRYWTDSDCQISSSWDGTNCELQQLTTIYLCLTQMYLDPLLMPLVSGLSGTTRKRLTSIPRPAKRSKM